MRIQAAGAALLGLLTFVPLVHASSVEEFPDNGSEQQARGGAWIARASDPLAAFYNPAGLAGQATQVTLQSNIAVQSQCFARVKALRDTTRDGVAPGGRYPETCNDARPNALPQLGLTLRVSDRIGIGLVILGPSAVGSSSWPEFVGNGSPAPQRYLILSTDAILLTPTLGAGFEVVDGLRLGASIQVGFAPKIGLVNAIVAQNADGQSPASNDVRAELSVAAWVIPGFTMGALWSAGSEVDVAGWYRWSAPLDARGDVKTAANYFTPQVAAGNTKAVTYGDTSLPDCNNPALRSAQPPPCGSGNNAELKIPIPMEAKIGVRYHKRRRGAAAQAHRRDPMSQDVFDVEVNFTWANDSAFDALELRFPATASGDAKLPANPSLPAGIPPNADTRHHFRDVFGIRLGGDYGIIADRLALRGGVFIETRSADARYQNLDFDGAERFGLAVGGTVRVLPRFDVMVGYGHVFFAALENTNPGALGLSGVAGTACNLSQGTSCSARYRTPWAVNLGRMTSSIDVVNLGAVYRF